METNKEFLTERIAESKGVEALGEYVLPDYLGDVRKLLLTTAEPTVMEKYKNGNNLDVSGVIRYDVIYEDSEGNLTPASFTGDFDASIPVTEGYVDSVVTAEVGGCGIRLKGPRRLFARSRVDVLARILERDEYRVDGDAFSSSGIISDCRTVEVGGATMAHGDEKEYREELGTIEGAILDEVAILGSRAEVLSVSIDKGEDSSEISADVLVEALVVVKGEMPHTRSSTITFISDLPLDCKDADAIPVVSVKSLSTSLDVGEEGVVVNATIVLEAECIAEENTKVRIISDCYSTERSLMCRHTDLGYTSHIGSQDVEGKVSHTVENKGESGNIRNILFLSASVESEVEEYCESGAKISGKIRFSGIACQINEEGEISYEPFKVDTPYEYFVKFNLQNPTKTTSSHTLYAKSPKCDIEDGKISLCATLCGNISFAENLSFSAVTAASLGEEIFSHDPSVITVYYPAPSDTLFDVARMFHTSPARIARDNELSDDVFRGGSSRSPLSIVDSLIIRQ